MYCGLKGKFFALERTPGHRGSPHLNLYGIDDNGDEVLMTMDHIIPKSKGGGNQLSNVQVMCYPCNSAKGDKIIK